MNPEERKKAEDDHKIHIKNKDEARKCMAEHKARAIEQPSICAACFDLQKVLFVPRAEISVLYYKRKLSIYNFTVYDLATGEAHCYVWDETTANRGGNEVASCLWQFIADKAAEGFTEFSFYSDNCSGQNRNQKLY